jgi:hypothetical protein
MPSFNKTAFMWCRASARRIPSAVIFPRAEALHHIKADFGSSENNLPKKQERAGLL